MMKMKKLLARPRPPLLIGRGAATLEDTAPQCYKPTGDPAAQAARGFEIIC